MGLVLKFAVFLFLVIFLAYGAGKWLSQDQSSEIPEQQVDTSLCDPSEKTCEIKNASGRYFLQFSGKPSALVPFEILIDFNESHIPVESVVVVFSMPDMDMGFNQYRLEKKSQNWHAKVILPVCSLSKNDWVMSVKMKFNNKISVTNFKFSQVNKF